MLKLQEIQEKLIRINGAAFQDLCDAFILNTEPQCDNIHRTGSQVGKQKTIPGTPDSYFVLPNGKYVLLEYTTQSPEPMKKLMDKIKDDIDKCVDSQQTGLNPGDIEKIIYCINSDLDTAKHKELMTYGHEKDVRLDIRSLSTLSVALLSKASPLAKEFLDIAIDSGQILDTAGFIKAYARSGYSTPLSNQLVGRETDLATLKASVLESPVTILTGQPGVGKTKLAIAFFEQIKNEGLPYQLFCIDNKHMPIYDDLKTFFPSSGNFILLIDDANRQLKNLKPILGLLKEERPGKLHILITVRDYALEEIDQLTMTYSPTPIRLQKFTDEELTALLGTPDFEIFNDRYVKRILEIADGNPRLAIMAAKVAIEKQTFDSLQDVTDLYDNYFGMTISSVVFSNTLQMKTLGIVSFFNSVGSENKEHYQNVLASFGMNLFEFGESLVELEKLELLESSPDLLTFKIADQVLGTYFFYYTFFKKPLLDFNVILQNYFISYYYRVRDTIIPANNTFGYTNVYEKVDPYLISYWRDISSDQDKALKFLDIFWMYKQDITLAFVLKKINSLPPVASPLFFYDQDKINREHGNKDDFLNLLSNFFSYSIETLKDALSLAALYVTKKPAQYGPLVKLLREMLIYHQEDETYGFYRQHELISMLSDQNSEVPLNLRARLFYDVIPALMKTSYQVVTGARKRNSMAIHRYNLPLTQQIQELRAAIWRIVNQWAEDHPIDTLLFLHEYLQRTPDKVKEVFSFDRTFLIELFNSRFTPGSFVHCYIVQEFITWFKRSKIKGEDYDTLKTTFTNNAYHIYQKLSYEYRRGKIDYGDKLTYEQFQSLKEKEIRKAFSITTVEQFQQFYTLYTEIDNARRLLTHNANLQYSLETVLHDAFLKNRENIQFYEVIAKSGNPTEFVPFRILRELAGDITAYQQFKESFINLDFKFRDLWLNNWYQLLPDDMITLKDARDFLAVIEHSTNIHYLTLNHLDKYRHIDEKYVSDLLEIVFRKNSNNSQISLEEFFKAGLEVISLDIQLTKKIYFQQQEKNNHFDHNLKIFYTVLCKDTHFLNEYISYWTKGYSFSLREHEGLSIAWNHPNAAMIIEQAMGLLCEKKLFSLRQDICNVLFSQIPPDKKENAKAFLERYILKNKENEDRIDAAFNCVRNNFPDCLEPIVLTFLNEQPSFDVFSKISWTTSFMIGNGNTSFGEIRGRQYGVILNILEKITDKTYRFSEHKAYLKERMAEEKRYAIHERRRKFLEQD